MLGRRSLRLYIGLFVATTSLYVLNALQLLGQPIARWGDAALQTCTCVCAIVCALATARRAAHRARLWRLLVAAAIASWLLGQLIWWHETLVLHAAHVTAPPIAVVAYFLFPALSMAALFVLNRTDGEPTRRHEGRLSRHAKIVLVLDGLVAMASFAVLVWSSAPTPGFHLAMPRSGGRPDTLAYSLVDLTIVVVAVLLMLAYRAGRHNRANLQLLAAGIVMIAASDRIVAYLVGVEGGSGRLWAAAGFILGPLLVAFAVPESISGPYAADAVGKRMMDWALLLLPNLGFAGMTVLLTFHTLRGHRLDASQVILSTSVITLVIARHVLALRDIELLVERVFAGQRDLLHQVRHDSLTGLPNRRLFAERLDAAVAGNEPFLLVYIDLDNFRDANDRFGHAAGDKLLCAVGQRLLSCVRNSDTVARIGGDEFGILFQGGPVRPEEIAAELQAVLRPPFAIRGTVITVKASMGLVTLDPALPDLSSDELLRRADISMYAGKRQGKGSAVVYQRSSLESTDFPTALRHAKGGTPVGFRLDYQSIVRLPEQTPVALEALARWTAPDNTIIPAETFVAAAEATGLGADLDALVLDLVCGDVISAGITLPVHVNVGAGRLGNHDFERVLISTLERHGLPPGQLVLEITESVPIVDLAEGAAAIRRLRAHGVRIALDDFGAGYNSLTYLHALPVDFIKLDRGLSIGIDLNHGAVLYQSVIGLCRDLGLEVVAEGVETVDQALTIYSAGCGLAQGYLFSRPGTLRDSTAIVAAQRLERPANSQTAALRA